MTSSLFTPDLRRILDDLARRLGILERRIGSQAASVDNAQEIIFSYAGALADGTGAPPVRIWHGGHIAVIAVTFAPGSAGSTDTILLVQRNGTTVDTVTVPASTEAYNAPVSARFAADSDTLSIEVDTAGTGAADMTAAARFA